MANEALSSLHLEPSALTPPQRPDWPTLAEFGQSSHPPASEWYVGEICTLIGDRERILGMNSLREVVTAPGLDSATGQPVFRINPTYHNQVSRYMRFLISASE